METKPSNVYLSLFSESEYYNEAVPQYIPSYDEITNSPFYKGVDYRNNQVFKEPTQTIPEAEKVEQGNHQTQCQNFSAKKCNIKGKFKYVIICFALFVTFIILIFFIRQWIMKSSLKGGPLSVADLVPSKEVWYVGQKYQREWVNAKAETCNSRSVRVTKIIICCDNILSKKNDTCNNLTNCMPFLNTLEGDSKDEEYDFFFDEKVNIYEGSTWPCCFLDDKTLKFGNIGVDICKHEYSIDDKFLQNIKKLIKFMDKKDLVKDDPKINIDNCKDN